MKTDIKGVTLSILFSLTFLCLLLEIRPMPEQGYLQLFVILIMLGAVPVVPFGIRQLIKLRPDIYSLAAISVISALAVGIYSLYGAYAGFLYDTSAFFLPSCILLLLVTVKLKLSTKADTASFDKIAFFVVPVLPVLAFAAAIMELFSTYSFYAAASVFSRICIYTGLIFVCSSVTMSIKKVIELRRKM